MLSTKANLSPSTSSLAWGPGDFASPGCFAYHRPDETGSVDLMATVLARIASGDGDAVQDCMDQYGGLVWSLARRLSPSSGDAEDAVQEVFLDLWKNASRFDASKSSEKTFIAMIARRRLIDRLRHKSRRPDLQAFNEDEPDPSGDQHREIELSVEAASAGRYLQQLKPDQRKVIKMSIYYGMSHSEISEVTRIPVGTVKSHIFRGLAAVRRSLSGSTTEQPS